MRPENLDLFTVCLCGEFVPTSMHKYLLKAAKIHMVIFFSLLLEDGNCFLHLLEDGIVVEENLL